MGNNFCWLPADGQFLVFGQQQVDSWLQGPGVSATALHLMIQLGGPCNDLLLQTNEPVPTSDDFTLDAIDAEPLQRRSTPSDVLTT